MPKLEVLLEAERRGILPEDKKALLAELRNRGKIPGAETPEQSNSTDVLGIAREASKALFPVRPTAFAAALNPSEAVESGKELLRGVVRGASMGTVGGKAPLEGSVMEPQLRKNLRGAGQFVGSVAPLVASEATAAAAVPRIAGRLGLAEALIPRATAAGAGVVYGGAQEVAQKGLAAALKDPVETGKNALATGAAFLAMSPIGEFLGKVRQAVGEKFPTSRGDIFVKADQKTRESLTAKGKPSVGEELIRRPELGRQKEEVYLNSLNNIKRISNQVEGELDVLTGKARETAGKEVQIKGIPRLEYNPAGRAAAGEALPGGFPGGQVIPVPVKSGIPEPKVGTIRSGNREPLRLEVPGRTLRGKNPKTGPRKIPSGVTDAGEVIEPGRIKSLATGEEIVLETSSQGAAASRRAKSEAFRNERSLEAGRPGFSAKRDIAIGKDEISGKLNDLISREKQAADRGIYERVKKEFVDDLPERMDPKKAFRLKQELDRKINDKYLADPDKVSAEIKAMESVANSYRRILAEKSPTLKALLKEQSALIQINRSVRRQLHANGVPMSIFPRMEAFFMRNTVDNLALARFLRRNLGQPSKVVSPLTKNLSRLGVGGMTRSEQE